MEKKKYSIEDLPPMSKEEKEFWEEHNNEYYHYLYKIDNKLNGKFYYGIHSEKKGNELGSDGYMGSGVDLVKDQKKDGIENFEKKIIKTFSTRDEARLEEFIVVNEELVKDPNCYNKVIGGGTLFITTDLVVVNYKDKSLRKDKFFLVTTEEYKNNKNKYITPTSDRITVKYKDNSLNINNSFFTINSDEYYKNKDKYITVTSKRGIYKNILDNKDIRILNTDDPLVLSGKFVGLFSGKSIYRNKDNCNDIRSLYTNDLLVLSGQFIGITNGIKQSQETILKKTGDKNGSYGTMWITNGKENRKINRNDSIPVGWSRGRVVNNKN